jgi:hypothetical protein
MLNTGAPPGQKGTDRSQLPGRRNKKSRVNTIRVFQYFFCATLDFRQILDEGVVMSVHLLAGVVVLLVLVAVSAYREALRNEPISRFRINPGKLPQMEESEESALL